jgi:hypothetical protein
MTISILSKISSIWFSWIIKPDYPIVDARAEKTRLIHPKKYICDEANIEIGLSAPFEDEEEMGKIAEINIYINLPCDIKGKCYSCMDIEIFNPVYEGDFSGSHSLSWKIDEKELHILSALPWMHNALIEDANDGISIMNLVNRLEQRGVSRSECFNEYYKICNDRYECKKEEFLNLTKEF